MNPAPAFHAGERALQARVGLEARMAQVGPLVMRDHMPDQHRAFFPLLPFALLGSVDAEGQPWASLIAGAPGFISSPDPVTLSVDAQPLPHDPLEATLRNGASLGLLGIQPHTRRRNRMNGLARLHEGGFTVEVAQSFGNCPKYIQAREAEWWADVPAAQVAYEGTGLDEASRALIRAADTFFIATAHPNASASAARRHGVDVSHRGGPPGFVKVEQDVLTVPDFAGNQFFNTLGNVALNPLTGLMLVDFHTGDRLYLAARGSLVWEGAELASFAGAQRLLRLAVTQVRRVRGGLPLRWGRADQSPYLAGLGAWPPALSMGATPPASPARGARRDGQ